MVTAERITIRPCEERDLDHFDWFGSDIHVQYCRDEFAQASTVILVAVSEDDVPVGKIHVHFEHREEAVWLEAAAVARSWRGQGIGTSLIHAAETLAGERGYRTVELGVEDSNPKARRLYDRLGYRSVARNDFQYVGAPVPNPGVTMRKELIPLPAPAEPAPPLIGELRRAYAHVSVTAEQVWAALDQVEDPEIPVVSLVDLGVVRDVQVDGDRVHVEFTPTFLGCPALEVMRDRMAAKIAELGAEPDVEVVTDDSWSTDRITPAGREKLREAGFAPPAPRPAETPTLLQLQRGFRCPYCGSTDTRLDNLFGPTPCRSIRYCESCRQPFEQFKTI